MTFEERYSFEMLEEEASAVISQLKGKIRELLEEKNILAYDLLDGENIEVMRECYEKEKEWLKERKIWLYDIIDGGNLDLLKKLDEDEKGIRFSLEHSFDEEIHLSFNIKHEGGEVWIDMRNKDVADDLYKDINDVDYKTLCRFAFEGDIAKNKERKDRNRVSEEEFLEQEFQLLNALNQIDQCDDHLIKELVTPQ